MCTTPIVPRFSTNPAQRTSPPRWERERQPCLSRQPEQALHIFGQAARRETAPSSMLTVHLTAIRGRLDDVVNALMPTGSGADSGIR